MTINQFAAQIKMIPQANFLHADRYDTDNEHVVHLWDDGGNSYDIRVSRIQPGTSGTPEAGPAEEK